MNTVAPIGPREPAPPAGSPGFPPLAVLWLLALVAGCREPHDGRFQGYLEGEFVHVAAPLGGTLTALAVARGDTVKTGQPLFALECAAETASLLEAESRLAQATARLANLRTGRRPSEVASIEAGRQRAEANLALSRAEWTRQQQLVRNSVVSAAEIDLARARFEADQALVRTFAADLETARLGARDDEIRAGEAEVEALGAAVSRARWAVDQKQRVAPAEARIHDTLYRVGEFVPAGLPVVSLLPPGNVKVRFFVPEPRLIEVKTGQGVNLRLDGRTEAVPATVSYVATQPEYTPPVIYNQENRARLVFMVEARLEPGVASTLHPGQPVDVILQP
ncbi:MAG: HlyD family secretion protein [Limisphaerales bacterium]